MMFNELAEIASQAKSDKDLERAIMLIARGHDLSLRRLCATFYSVLYQVIDKNPVTTPPLYEQLKELNFERPYKEAT